MSALEIALLIWNGVGLLTFGAFAAQWAGRTERHLREVEERVSVAFDRMNQRDGLVRRIPLTDEQRESLTVRSPLPTAKVVRR